MTTRAVTEEEAVLWENRLWVIARYKFVSLPKVDHEDMVQEAIKNALIRGMLFDAPTWREATNLLIDAYRTTKRSKRKLSMVPVANEDLHQLADPPNQITDMELMDKILTPEEQEFENQLRDEQAKGGMNLAREAASRAALGSTRILPSDLWALLP